MLTKENMNIFLDETVNEKTFPLYSSLYNLQDPELFRSIIDLLYYKKINFFDLLNIPLIDDRAVKELLENKNKYLLPIYNTDDVKTFNIYNYLMVDTPLETFFNSYNSYMNGIFNIKNESIYSVSSYSIIAKTNTYNSATDFENTFKNKVVTSLLQEYSIANISVVFPKFILDTMLNEKAALFLNTIKNDIFSSIQERFTNERLSELFILTTTHSSVVLDNYALFTSLLNLQEFNNSSDIYLSTDLHNLSTKINLEHTQLEIDSLWDDLFTTEFDFSSSINDSLGFIKYKISLIMTLEKKNNLDISTLVYTEFLKLYDFIADYSLLHKKIDSLIVSNLNVQVL